MFFSNFTGIYLTRALEKNIGLLNLNLVQEAMNMVADDLVNDSKENEIIYADLLSLVWCDFLACAEKYIQYDKFRETM